MTERRVTAGVFVHNEEARLVDCLRDLRAQRVPEGVRLEVLVLANGSKDRSVELARAEVAGWTGPRHTLEVFDFPEPGKGRTWNRFVELGEARGSDVLVFVDGDIRIHEPEAIAIMLEELDAPGVRAVASQAVAVFPPTAPPLLRALFERTKTDHGDGKMAGSFYAARLETVRELRVPHPCLVEDGFLAACIVTDLFSGPGEPSRIRGSRRLRHEYEGLESLQAFFKHSVRVALGTEMNAALFTPLWGAPDRAARRELLEAFARGERMEEAFAQHQSSRGNSALTPEVALRDLRERLDRDGVSPARLPFQVAKLAYLLAVNAQAARLFRERRFRW